MKTFAIVPVKRFEHSKTRLSNILVDSDRTELSYLMLRRTLRVLLATRRLNRIVIVSADSRVESPLLDERIVWLSENQDNGVNSAVSLGDKYCELEGAEASIVVPVDLPLLEPGDVDAVVEAGEEMKCGIVICPSQRRDGTNALLRKPPLVISTQYDNNSYHEHLKSAERFGIESQIQTPQGFVQDLDNAEDAAFIVRINGKQNDIAGFLRSKAQSSCG